MANGGVYFVQGKAKLDAKEYLTATTSFADSADSFFKGKDENNAQKAMAILLNDCIPSLEKKSYSDHPIIEKALNRLLVTLNKFNENGRYEDKLSKLNLAIKKSKEREIKTA
jgi:hypothetical protein